MEYLSLEEIQSRSEKINAAIEDLLKIKAIVGKPSAKQWRFFKACVQRLLNPALTSEFDYLSAVQAAQLKFEVEDSLRRFYMRPGRQIDFVFALVHKKKLDNYGYENNEQYPSLAGYCVLIRDLEIEKDDFSAENSKNLKLFIERVVAEAIDAEFRAYMNLPEIELNELKQWFYKNSPAMKEILNLLERHKKKGWILSNRVNPSTKRLLNIKVKKISLDEATVNTMEYWYLRWWDTKEESYAYPYRETNRQIYILKRENGEWKVYENLRPSPRSSTPHRRKR